MSARKIIFMWDNFGPMHMDKTEAVASFLAPEWEVIGIELFGKSVDYAWESTEPEKFKKITLVPSDQTRPSTMRLTCRLMKACLKSRGRTFFFCHYEKMPVFLTALLLRLTGARLFSMADSKFDDYERYLWREVIKSIFLLPYSGTIVASKRARDYRRFLGFPKSRIEGRYYVISLERLRTMAGAPIAPAGVPHSDRDFIAVARFVPKKNLEMLLLAFALYSQRSHSTRKLILCGGGILEPVLQSLAEHLGIADRVVFHGFVQTDEVCRLLSRSLALLLLSTEEQFGQVVFEAQALGVPAIVTDAVGARDELIRSGVNGFVVEPDNAVGTSFFMAMLCQDEALWRSMAEEAAAAAPLSATIEYVRRVANLIGTTLRNSDLPSFPDDCLPKLQLARLQAALESATSADSSSAQ